ncbi:hypothetical protein [Streptomyces salyersiae]|uniref:XRE family transcriptional regulator n=1 Tax=Streptomyces salyersiae TaxID=3075530 RepID=A0ABU2RJT0_9ACTN|nr:hypothetical protein [Streptomyces sp. DSM 41770]MDT0429091.1 hypothetical protein [Streptomyces sp. DSM 41770]
MEPPKYPGPDVLLARLAQSRGVALPTELPPKEGFLNGLADQLGLRIHDLFLIGGLPVPEEALDFDERPGNGVRILVEHVLPLDGSGRQRVMDHARTLASGPRRLRIAERTPRPEASPGYGSLLKDMLALRNLNESAAAKVMCLVSGVCKSASTIALVRNGRKELDAELLDGFAAVLGVPVTVLTTLTGVRRSENSRELTPQVVDVAALIWEIRHLSHEQVRGLADLAEEQGRT